MLPKLADCAFKSLVFALGLLIAAPFFLAMAAPFFGGL